MQHRHRSGAKAMCFFDLARTSRSRLLYPIRSQGSLTGFTEAPVKNLCSRGQNRDLGAEDFHSPSAGAAIIPRVLQYRRQATATSHVTAAIDAQLHPAVCQHDCRHLVSGSFTKAQEKKQRRSFHQGSEVSQLGIRIVLALGANPPPAVKPRRENAITNKQKDLGPDNYSMVRSYMIREPGTSISQSSGAAAGTGLAGRGAGACSVIALMGVSC